MQTYKSSAGRAGRGVKRRILLQFLQDALFVDPYAKALSGDGLGMSDRLGEAGSQFGFKNWPEFHKVLISGGLAARYKAHWHTYQIISASRSYQSHIRCPLLEPSEFLDVRKCLPCLGHFGQLWTTFTLITQVWTVIRTKFIDDILSEVAVPQMVNQGAGVDTRPFRLTAYERFKASYEVDTAEVCAA